MESLHEYFKLEITKDKTVAKLDIKKDISELTLDEQLILSFLDEHQIIFGIDNELVEQLAVNHERLTFPVTIAKGLVPINGQDGQITYLSEQNEELELEEKRDFRDVKKIPVVKKGEKIAVISTPTLGKNGRDIFNQEVSARPGKPVRVRAGKNVVYDNQENIFYATKDGQLSIQNKVIHVYDTYELTTDMSLKTGNLKFIGSIIIRGNVPSGYRVEAEGDVYIYGLVEAAYIEAKGNIVITEGVAGLRKGTLISGGNTTVGYVNQAIIDAGADIIVHHSIMHSHCVAKDHIVCETGNIIGGLCTAGKTIITKDVGNRMDTKTELALGNYKKEIDIEAQLQKDRNKKLEQLDKLRKLGDKLQDKQGSTQGLTAKERIILLKQRNASLQTQQELQEIEAHLSNLADKINEDVDVRLYVKGTMYPNTELNFGKYKKIITIPYKFTQVYLQDGEIQTSSL